MGKILVGNEVRAEPVESERPDDFLSFSVSGSRSPESCADRVLQAISIDELFVIFTLASQHAKMFAHPS